MENRRHVRAVLRLGANVFTGLGTAYFIAVSLSSNLLSLTNNMMACIVCLYTAYLFEEYLDDE